MKRSKRTLSVIMSLVIITLMLAGCSGNGGQKNEPAANSGSSGQESQATENSEALDQQAESNDSTSGERVDFNFVTLGTDTPMEETYYPTDFVVQLEEDMNINLIWNAYDNDKMNLALASGDLPDVIATNTGFAKQILDAGLAINLDDYLDDYGQNIKALETRNEIIRKFISNGDGNLYFITPSTGPSSKYPGSELWNGWVVRWDLYKEIGAPSIKSIDDYVDVLKQMQALNPQTEDGYTTYGLGLAGASGLWHWNINMFAIMGYINNTVWAYAANAVDNNLYHNYLDTENGPFWKAMELYYKLNREGLFDPDSYTMKDEERNEKYNRGQYVGATLTWMCGDFNTNERKKDPETNVGFMAIPPEGNFVWDGAPATAGWGDKIIFATTSAKDPILAVKFIDYLNSPEANLVHWRGKQGVYWDYVDGVPTPFESTLELRSAGGDNWKKTGIESWSNQIGIGVNSMSPDGYPYTLFDTKEAITSSLNSVQKDYSDYYGVEFPSQLYMNMFEEGKIFNQVNSEANAINIGISTVPSDITRIDSKVDEIALKAIPTLIEAQSDQEFETAKEKFIQDIINAGAEEAWEWWQTQWNSSKDVVMEAKK